MYGLNPNFTVAWSGGLREFPYWNAEQYAEQKARAFELYAVQFLAGLDVTLTRLSSVDLAEGDAAPTLLRRSDDPSYAYDGFPEAWEARV